MPKLARIDVVKVGGSSPYKVDVPASLSESGKRERRYFTTKVEAETYRDNQRSRVKNVGIATALLTPTQRDVALRCFGLLGDAPPQRLEEIVQAYLGDEKARKASVSVEKAFTMFDKAKKSHRSDPYLRQISDCKKILAPLAKVLLTDVQRKDLEPLFEGLPAARRNLLLRVARAVFNFGIKREWLRENPVVKLEFSEIKNGEVEVFSNRQVARLLVACKRHALELLPYHTIGLFAGVRPEELERLRWDMVRMDEGIIRLPGSVTKTGRTRTIEIEPALKAWLEFYEQEKEKGTGLIVGQKNLRRRLRSVRKKARMGDWIQDGMRHTYASNWLAVHGDINKLTLHLGHTRPAMLWQHYHTAVLKKDAVKFWELYPKNETVRVEKEPSTTGASTQESGG